MQEDPFVWTKHWYPLAVIEDLNPEKPFATKLLGASSMCPLSLLQTKFLPVSNLAFTDQWKSDLWVVLAKCNGQNLYLVQERTLSSGRTQTSSGVALKMSVPTGEVKDQLYTCPYSILWMLKQSGILLAMGSVAVHLPLAGVSHDR